MKTLFIADIHLKARLILPIVKEKIKTQGIQQVVFLGDYVDFYEQKENASLYLKDLTYLNECKKELQSQGIKVINLIGNHDIYYLIDQPAHFSLLNKKAFPKVRDLLYSLDLQVAYKIDDYIISHAGFTKSFSVEDWHLKTVTAENKDQLTVLAKTVGPLRGGSSTNGSPVWADRQELDEDINPNYPKQIVGHTPQEKIELNQNVIAIDTFSIYPTLKQKRYEFLGNGDLLLYDNGDFSVLKTNWDWKYTFADLRMYFNNKLDFG